MMDIKFAGLAGISLDIAQNDWVCGIGTTPEWMQFLRLSKNMRAHPYTLQSIDSRPAPFSTTSLMVAIKHSIKFVCEIIGQLYQTIRIFTIF